MFSYLYFLLLVITAVVNAAPPTNAQDITTGLAHHMVIQQLPSRFGDVKLLVQITGGKTSQSTNVDAQAGLQIAIDYYKHLVPELYRLDEEEESSSWMCFWIYEERLPGVHLVLNLPQEHSDELQIKRVDETVEVIQKWAGVSGRLPVELWRHAEVKGELLTVVAKSPLISTDGRIHTPEREGGEELKELKRLLGEGKLEEVKRLRDQLNDLIVKAETRLGHGKSTAVESKTFIRACISQYFREGEKHGRARLRDKC